MSTTPPGKRSLDEICRRMDTMIADQQCDPSNQTTSLGHYSRCLPRNPLLPKPGTRRKYFLPLIYVVLCLFLLSIGSQAEDQLNAKRQQVRSKQKEPKGRRMTKEVLQEVLENVGIQTWSGFEETRELAASVRPHKDNARSLSEQGVRQTKRAGLYHTKDYYAIGSNVVVAGAKQAKDAKKGKGKSQKGKGIANPASKGGKQGSTISPSQGGGYNPPIARPPKPTLPTIAPFIAPHLTPHQAPSPSSPVPSPNVVLPTGGGGGSNCRIPLTVAFLQLSAKSAVYVDPSVPNPQDVGTQFIYKDSIYNQTTLDQIANSTASGFCSRTQQQVSIGVETKLGEGVCTFVYTLFDGKNKMSFTATGEVSDQSGGILAVTGGTQSAQGAYGEIELLPVNLVNGTTFVRDNGDFFQNPLFYLADATLSLPCP